MNLADLRSQFEGLLDRSDCTDTQANTFLVQAMQRISREARLPSMERMYLFAPTVPMEQVPIPADFIQAIDLLVQGDPTNADEIVALEMLPYRRLVRHTQLQSPRYYGRLQGAFHVRGLIQPGAQVQLVYYGEFATIQSDASENEIMASSPDLVCYGALALAGDWFEHPKAETWEQRYQQFLSQVVQLAQDVEFGGGPMVVQSAHSNYED